ncbi:MAG: asparagine synthetase B [Candidatus Bathyarchaeia archaeon]
MGALISIISKDGRNVIPEAIKMLSALKHRGSKAHGISTDRMTNIVKNFDDFIDLSDDGSSVVMGYNFSQNLPDDAPQPIEGDNFKIVFDGRIFSPHIKVREVVDFIKQFSDVKHAIRNLIERTEGSFSLTILKDGKLYAGRDPLGAKPLYFCESKKFYALASERKALWLLGIDNKNIKSFPPGNLAEIDCKGIIFQPIKLLEKPKIKPLPVEKALKELYKLLLNSIRVRTLDLEKVSIAFSGGLDSSVIAALIRESGVDAFLVSVGLEGTKDLEQSEKVANEIGLPLKTKVYTLDDVEKDLPTVLWLIEEANALKASICIPEFWAAEISSGIGCQAMFSGQGSDELFGGYHKYLKEYAKSADNVEWSLYNDMLMLYESSLEPEEKLCSFQGLESRFPYVDFDLVSFALSLPISQKISSVNDPLRKRILRHLAEYIGLPEDVYLTPKKAIQYSTGVSQALKKIARKNKLKMQEFINRVFQRIEWSNEDSNSVFS